jgi:hypothetical protein
MKAYWGRGCIAPRILDLGTRRRWMVSFSPRPPYPQGKSPYYPLYRRLGGPQSRSGHGGEEKNFSPWQDSNPDHPARSPALYRWAILAPSFTCKDIKSRSFRWAGHVTRIEKQWIIQNFYLKTQGNRPLWRCKRGWEDNIKTNHNVVLLVVNYTGVCQDRIQWRAFVNVMMDFLFS